MEWGDENGNNRFEALSQEQSAVHVCRNDDQIQTGDLPPLVRKKHEKLKEVYIWLSVLLMFYENVDGHRWIPEGDIRDTGDYKYTVSS